MQLIDDNSAGMAPPTLQTLEVVGRISPLC